MKVQMDFIYVLPSLRVIRKKDGASPARHLISWKLFPRDWFLTGLYRLVFDGVVQFFSGFGLIMTHVGYELRWNNFYFATTNTECCT